MAKKPKELVVLDKCKQQLATIKDLPTLLAVRDKAMAIANFQRARDDGKETSNYGKSIAMRAEANLQGQDRLPDCLAARKIAQSLSQRRRENVV